MENHITAQERKNIAALAGVHEQYLYQCLTGRRDMNPGEARRVEDLTNKVVRREMLCQKTWQAIWPELAARADAPTAKAA